MDPLDSALLREFYALDAAEPPWPQVLAQLRARLVADAVALVLPSRIWMQGGPIAPPALTGLRPNRVYTGEELADRRLLPAGAVDARLIDFGAGALLATRSRGSFRAADSALLAALAPHLVQAVRLWDAQARQRADMAHMQAILARLRIGRVSVAATGGVQPIDPIARRLLAEAGPLRAVDPKAGPVILLAPDLDLLIDPGLPQSGLVRHRAAQLAPAEVIALNLGISLPEARLARALGHGASIAQAARLLNLTEETARTYSRRLYAQSGHRSQAALVRALWTSALALA
jgi:DNA-binding CsgD family transcriptional regulator